MPDITGKQSYSAVAGPARPSMGQHYTYEPLGSKDTSLGRFVFSNYYDKAFIPSYSQADQRYYNQGNLNAAGNWLASLGTKTFGHGIPAIAGAVTSLLASPLALSSSISFEDVFEKNPLNIIAKSVSKAADEYFPLNQRQDFHDLNFLQQLSRPGELATANIDTFSFLAESFLGGGLIGKAGLGAKLAPKLSKADDVSAVLTKLTGPNLARKAAAIDFELANTLMTINEAAAEGKDGAEQVREKLYSDRAYGNNNMTDEEIEAKAQQTQFNVFWTNAIALGITNRAFTKMLAPLFKNAPASTRTNPFALEKAKDVLVNKKTYSGFQKYLFDKGYAPGQTAKAFLTQLGTEGLLEENMQYSIQKVSDAEHVNEGL